MASFIDQKYIVEASSFTAHEISGRRKQCKSIYRSNFLLHTDVTDQTVSHTKLHISYYVLDEIYKYILALFLPLNTVHSRQTSTSLSK